MKRKLEQLAANTAKKIAVTACGAASQWSTYQPKEPASLKKAAK